jgi:hypothetical protein
MRLEAEVTRKEKPMSGLVREVDSHDRFAKQIHGWILEKPCSVGITVGELMSENKLSSEASVIAAINLLEEEGLVKVDRTYPGSNIRVYCSV